MSLAKFEQRMMRLKGIKLPSQGVREPTYSSNGKRPQIISNRINGLFRTSIDTGYETDDEQREYMYAVTDDILQGVVRSFGTAESHKGFKINASVVRSMLDKLPNISQLSIMENYGYGRQQASKYLQACRLFLLMYNRHELKQLRSYAE